jgi:hypothetical protein
MHCKDDDVVVLNEFENGVVSFEGGKAKGSKSSG